MAATGEATDFTHLRQPVDPVTRYRILTPIPLTRDNFGLYHRDVMFLTHKLLVRVLCLAIAAAKIGCSDASAPDALPAQHRRPNIVFIISDDHRWDALGAAGNPGIHTPVQDRLATQGVYFRQATVNIPQCAPSRASLLTGLPAHRHGVYSNQHQREGLQIRPDHPTHQRAARFDVPLLPDLMRQAGYRTVMVGKWHLPPAPWNCGFDEVPLWTPWGETLYQNPTLARGPTHDLQAWPGYTDALLTDAAIEFLHSDRAKDGPFLLWMAMVAPHAPFEPNPPHIQALYDGATDAELAPPTFADGDEPGPFRIYYEAVSMLDEQVGRILETLEAEGLAEDTIVVFLGDNGFMMGSRGIGADGVFGKVYPYEDSIRAPLMIHAPGIARMQGAHDAPVSALDLPVTFLHIAGLDPPSDWPGRNLLPLMRNEAHEIDYAVCEFPDNRSERFGRLAYRVVRTPAHKLIWWEDLDRPTELYDLQADPRERHNLADQPEYQALLDEMVDRLHDWMRHTADPALAEMQQQFSLASEAIESTAQP